MSHEYARFARKYCNAIAFESRVTSLAEASAKTSVNGSYGIQSSASRGRWLVTLVICVVSVEVAFAQASTEPPAEPEAAAAAPAPLTGTMNREEIETCLDMQDAFKSRQSAFALKAERFEADQDVIRQELRSIAEVQRKSKTLTRAAMNEVNVRIEALNKRIEKGHAVAASFETEERAVSAAAGELNYRCAARRYFQSDWDSALKARRPKAAGRAASTATAQ